MIVGAHNRKVYNPVHNSRHLSLFLPFVGQRRGEGGAAGSCWRERIAVAICLPEPLPVPECPLTFPEVLFTRGCVGRESSLLNHSIYEWRETKTRVMFRVVMQSLPEGSRVLNYQRVKQANPPKRTS